MTLGQAKTKIRIRTRHVNDTVRLTETALNQIVNDVYDELRLEMQQWAPTYGLVTGPALTFAAGDNLSLPGVSNVFRVERKIFEQWRPVPQAETVDPEQIPYAEVAWELRHTCITLHPEGEVSSSEHGEMRVLYWSELAELTDDGESFTLPEAMINVLVYRACAVVAMDDGDDPAAFEKLADKTLERVQPGIEARYGVHSMEGLREVLGY